MSGARGQGPIHAAPTVVDLSELVGCQLRKEILIELSRRTYRVTDLAEEMDLSIAGVSYHIRRLFRAGLVVFEQVKRSRYYRLSPSIEIRSAGGQFSARYATGEGACVFAEQAAHLNGHTDNGEQLIEIEVIPVQPGSVRPAARR